MSDTQGNKRNLLIATTIIAGASLILLYAQGRVLWCAAGDAYNPWFGDIWSSHNSQHLFDPYTFTHVLHGVLYCGIAALILPRASIWWRFALAVSLGSFWELLENSNMVIERYRAATISLDYFGDSVLNAFGDILSCAFGFWLAYKLGWIRSIFFFLLTEIILILWIKDSLLINILMLIYPIDAIKLWQAG